MTILEIKLYPDPALLEKSRPVEEINDDIRQLASDMMETMVAKDGVGLAANQVGVLKRMISINLPEESPYWLVNPEILKRKGVRPVWEGCLSMPGYYGMTNRSVKVRAQALDQNGDMWRVTAQELLAQVLEHEIDHLNGIMYMDHLAEHEQLRKHDVSEQDTHMHDIRYRVESHKHDGDENPEILTANAKLSEISSEHSLSELKYDLE